MRIVIDTFALLAAVSVLPTTATAQDPLIPWEVTMPGTKPLTAGAACVLAAAVAAAAPSPCRRRP